MTSIDRRKKMLRLWRRFLMSLTLIMTVKNFHFKLLILKIFYKYNECVLLITYNNLYYHQFRNIFIPRVTILGRLSLREIILCYRRFGYRVYESKNPLKIVSNFCSGRHNYFSIFCLKIGSRPAGAKIRPRKKWRSEWP